MLIDGKAIADTKLSLLKKEVKQLSVTPTLAVILIGNDPASLAYIKQKQKAAEAIGANVVVSHLPAGKAGQSSAISKADFKKLVLQYNDDLNIHGIIIQRPIPKEIGDVQDILNLIEIKKDVDGFLSNSPFSVPVAVAVEEILKSISNIQYPISNIVVIGRGETAGKPIADHLTKLGFTPIIIHSQTPNHKQIMKSADIIISCVGKKRVITSENIKQGVILISVGIWRDVEGKLHGDYDETDIENKASYYTPTPKGVGPVNVACLMQNLIKACMLNKEGQKV